MNDKQSKALCSLLTIILVLLFVMVLYRVFQSLEQIEENMQDSIKNVEQTESGLNTTLNNFLHDKTVSEITEKERAEYKQLCEKNKQKYGLGKNTVCDTFVLEEEEHFHGNMIKKLEPFTSDNTQEQLQTKIDAIQKLLHEITNKTSMSLKSAGDTFKATVSFDAGINVKNVNILLQEYSIEGNSTELFVIPETVGDKYSTMCVETVKTIKSATDLNTQTEDFNIKLSPCKFFDSLDNTKPFLFKLEEIKGDSDNNGNVITGHKIRPFVASNKNYSLGVKLIINSADNSSSHILELLSEDPASNSIDSKNVFQLTKV